MALASASALIPSQQDPEVRLPRADPSVVAARQRRVDLGGVVQVVDRQRREVLAQRDVAELRVEPATIEVVLADQLVQLDQALRPELANRSISSASDTYRSRSTCANRSNVSNGRLAPSTMMTSALGIQSSSSAEIRWPTTSRGLQPSAVSGVPSHESGSPASNSRTTRGVRSSSATVSARNVSATIRLSRYERTAGRRGYGRDRSSLATVIARLM